MPELLNSPSEQSGFAPPAIGPLAPALGPAPVDDFPYPPDNLPSDDGVPLESNWHRHQMNFLIEIIEWHRRGRTDFFAGGNMFIYFSSEQVRNRDFRGPDFFLANKVSHRQDRPYWAIWDEGGRYPNLIIELSSPTTHQEDFTTKFRIYEEVFATREYVIYDPEENRIWAWRKDENDIFRPLVPNERGQVFLKEAGLWLGTWFGKRMRFETTWLRFFDDAGNVVPNEGEAEAARAEAEAERAANALRVADSEKARADVLAAELERLKAQLQGS